MSQDPAASASSGGQDQSGTVSPTPTPTAPRRRSRLDQVRAERGVLAAVSAIRLDEARALLDRDHHDELFALLADADIRLREGQVDIAELQALRDDVERLAIPSALAWAWAILADRLLMIGDPAAFFEASKALDVLPPDPAVGDTVQQYARSRLLRVAAASSWMHPIPEGLTLHRRFHDEAVTCLLRCGFTEEAEAAGAVSAGIYAIIVGDDVVEAYHRAKESRAAFPPERGSGWAVILDFVIACLALLIDDRDSARTAASRLEVGPSLEPFTLVAPFVFAALRLLEDGPTAGTLVDLDTATDAMRPYPRFRQSFLMRLAEILIDHGSDAARRVCRQALALPALSPLHAVERGILQLRVATLDGEHPDPERADELLTTLADMGRPRGAGRRALALAHDCDRLGDTREAARLWAWGVEKLPEPAERTLAEARLSRPVVMPTAAKAEPGTVHVAILVPRLHVEVDGRVAHVRNMAAVLLLGLVVAHPRPLHVEQVCELLWPGQRGAAVRSRLTTVTHRLRRALEPAGDAVSRQGELLALDDRRLSCDLWAYRSALAKDERAAARALLTVRGALCNAQFPYTEWLVEERQRFVARWVREAHAALARGLVDRNELTRVQRALDVHPDEAG